MILYYSSVRFRVEISFNLEKKDCFSLTTFYFMIFQYDGKLAHWIYLRKQSFVLSNALTNLLWILNSAGNCDDWLSLFSNFLISLCLFVHHDWIWRPGCVRLVKNKHFQHRIVLMNDFSCSLHSLNCWLGFFFQKFDWWDV